jgi:hypothetical protein
MPMPDIREKEPGASPSSLPITLKDREAIRDRIASLVESARRELIVFVPQMDAYFFNGADVARSLASFAARHRYNRARLLVEDATQTLRDNDRLVGVCRRLSEFIQLRQVSEQHLGLREMFVIVDGVSYLHQLDVTEPECVVEPAGRKRAAELCRRFEAMWERSEPALGLHSAGLRS